MALNTENYQNYMQFREELKTHLKLYTLDQNISKDGQMA